MKSFAIVVLAFLCCVTIALCQTDTASISGRVADPSGAAMSGADVQIQNVLTGQNIPTKTNSDGLYVATALQPGKYRIIVSNPGFKQIVKPDIVLNVQDNVSVNFSMEVGSVSESVTVQAGAELVTTQGASIGAVIGEQPITELPLNGRNPASLINITPGAVDMMSTGVGFNETYVNFPAETAASVGGQRQGNVYYTLDGSNAMDSWGGLATPMPNPDATQEFKVTSNNADAESGFSTGGTVSIITRSGTNQWHGDVFEFLRNGQLNSRGWFETAADELHRNQFGGSIGGKVIRDKLFVFFNYQGTVNHQTVNGLSTVVPNTMAVAGNFGFLCTNGFDATTGICNDRSVSASAPAGTVCNPGVAPSANCMIADQLYMNQPAVQANNGTNAFLNNTLDPSTYNPVALKLETLFPSTNDPGGRVSTAGTLNPFDYNEGTAKVDYILNSANHISYRAFVDNYNNPSTGKNIIFATRNWPVQYQTHTGSWTWTALPNLLNNFIFSYSRNFSDSTSGYNKNENITALGATGVATDPTYPTSLGIILDGWNNCLCENFNGFNRYTINLSDSVTYTKGKHLITAGVDVLYNNQYGGTDWGAVPIINIDGSQTGNWMSDFLLGQVQSFGQSGGGFSQIYQPNYSIYGTDTIRLKPNLTVNGGVRWEPFIAETTPNNKIGTWRPGEQSTRFPNAPLGEVYPGDAGIPVGTIPNRYGLFSPRIGIAWQPKLLPHTSIRSGFGMFNALTDGTLQPGTIDPPFTPGVTINAWTGGVGTVSLTNPWANYAPTNFTSPFPPFSTPQWNPPKDSSFLSTSYFGYLDPRFTSGKNESWNLSVERQIGATMVAKVAYVGSHAFDLPMGIDQNPGQFVCGPVGPNCTQAQYNMNGTRPIPYVQALYDATSSAVSSYNGLLLSFDKKFSHGLLFSANYTWSKTLDEFSVGHFDGSPPSAVSDPFNIRHDYGISDLNFPRIFNMYWVYISPGLKGSNGFVRGLFATWQISGIWHMQSGRPFSIGGGDNSFSLQSADRADIVAGQKTGTKVEKSQPDASGYIPYLTNPNAFTVNALGTFGNSGRNILQAPGANNWDLGMSKNFQMSERFRLQIRGEAFNAFNRTQFAAPDTNIYDKPAGYLGVLSGLQNAPRVIQFAGKLYF
jgi:hypothetical protein